MFQCPNCGSSEILIVEAQVEAQLDAEGDLECLCNNLDFENSSRVDCGVCGHHAAASNFEFPDSPSRSEIDAAEQIARKRLRTFDDGSER